MDKSSIWKMAGKDHDLLHKFDYSLINSLNKFGINKFLNKFASQSCFCAFYSHKDLVEPMIKVVSGEDLLSY